MASIRERPRKDGTVCYAVLYTLDGRQSSLPFDNPKAADAFKAAVEAHGAARALGMHGIAPAPRRASHGPTVATWIAHHIEHLSGVGKHTATNTRGATRTTSHPRSAPSHCRNCHVRTSPAGSR